MAHREGFLPYCKGWGAAEPVPFHWHAETLSEGTVSSSLPGGRKARVWQEGVGDTAGLISGLLDTPGLVSSAVHSRVDQH